MVYSSRWAPGEEEILFLKAHGWQSRKWLLHMHKKKSETGPARLDRTGLYSIRKLLHFPASRGHLCSLAHEHDYPQGDVFLPTAGMFVSSACVLKVDPIVLAVAAVAKEPRQNRRFVYFSLKFVRVGFLRFKALLFEVRCGSVCHLGMLNLLSLYNVCLHPR